MPAAIEVMDALAIEAAEAAAAWGYPEGAGAVLLVEVDGPAEEVAEELAEVKRICSAAGAIEIREATDPPDRAAIWRGRKSAFAAVGHLSVREMAELAGQRGLRVANVFHAGDGNLHPLILFDSAKPGETELAEELAGDILLLCLRHGGSITGEHGVGADKARFMPKMFTEDDLDTMQMLRCAFDPAGIANPGKIYPMPRLCGERPGRRTGPHPLQEAGLGEVF